MLIERVAVLGTGLMGKGISNVFALSGYKVDLFGRRDDTGSEFMEYLKNEIDKGRLTNTQKDVILGNIRICNMNSQTKRLEDSEVIIETVKEDIQIKKEIFETISDYIRNDAILASNTSSYSITRLAKFVPNPENFLGIHFFSPVPLMKLVEVVQGSKTNVGVVQLTCEFLKKIGKLPIQVKDSPGFVLNRGLFVMVNEAIHMLNERITDSADDIDSIFINGMGMKVGPLKLADMVGNDIVYTILLNLYEGLAAEKYKPCIMLERMVNEGQFGKKSGRGFYSYSDSKKQK